MKDVRAPSLCFHTFTPAFDVFPFIFSQEQIGLKAQWALMIPKQNWFPFKQSFYLFNRPFPDTSDTFSD